MTAPGDRFAPNACAGAFMRTAQYMASMRHGSKVLEEARQIVLTAFAADTVMFLPNGPVGEPAVWREAATEVSDTLRGMVEQVRDSGFMATETTSQPGPAAWIALPVAVRGRQDAVMLVGYDGETAPPRHLLEALLGVAALVGSTLERQLSDLELRDAATHTRLTLDAVGEGVCRVDTAGIVTFANRAALDILGCTEKQLIGRPAADLFVTEDERDIGSDRRREVMLRRRDGSAFPAELVSVPIVRDGLPAGRVATFADISDRKANQVLQMEIVQHIAVEAKLQLAANVFTHAREGIAITDAAGCIVNINDAFTRITGFARDEAIGRNPRLLQSGLQSKKVYALMRTALLDQGHWDGEIWARRKTGEVYAQMLTVSAVRDKDGTTQNYVALFTDITAMKDHQTQLERSNAELEQFAYVASHDLREPLRMISSFMSLLERHYGPILDESGREYLSFAREGAKRMDRLVLDLLDFSRIGRLGAPIVTMAVFPAIRTAIHHLAPVILETGAVIRCDEPSPSPMVMGDVDQITRLFQNLIGNALKYRAPDRRPEITLDVRRVGDEWEFHVIDNGIGIEAAYLDRIFGIFQRLHTRETYDGTGIGLAICKKIVELHGGQIQASSVPGEWSDFHFTLKGHFRAA